MARRVAVWVDEAARLTEAQWRAMERVLAKERREMEGWVYLGNVWSRHTREEEFVAEARDELQRLAPYAHWKAEIQNTNVQGEDVLVVTAQLELRQYRLRVTVAEVQGLGLRVWAFVAVRQLASLVGKQALGMSVADERP